MRALITTAAAILALGIVTNSATAQTPQPEAGRAQSSPITQFQAKEKEYDKLPTTRPQSMSPQDYERARIHEMAMECIRANNSSAACNDVINTDAADAKRFIRPQK